MTTMKAKLAVIGASGTTGGELLRLLLTHPQVDAVYPVARTEEPLERIHRNLLGSGLAFMDLKAVKARAGELHGVFFATPPAEALAHARDFLDRGAKVVDLSAAFRFRDPALYGHAYGDNHSAPDLLREAVYGVTEFVRADLRNARLVANPGCYVITALLALAPLLREGYAMIEEPIAISALNGTSGAGSSPKREVMHASAANDVLAYSLEGHRHTPEIEDQLSRLAGRPVTVNFNTAHGNFPRGIFLQASLRAAPHVECSRESLIDLYQRAYGKGAEQEFFVRIVDEPRSGKRNDKEYHLYPSVARVAGSNFCHIGLDWDTDRRLIKVVAVIDNLVKGAAGSAIQNMNVMLGLDEKLGLLQYGL